MSAGGEKRGGSDLVSDISLPVSWDAFSGDVGFNICDQQAIVRTLMMAIDGLGARSGVYFYLDSMLLPVPSKYGFLFSSRLAQQLRGVAHFSMVQLRACARLQAFSIPEASYGSLAIYLRRQGTDAVEALVLCIMIAQQAVVVHRCLMV